MPPGNIDVQAASLAKAVNAGDNSSTAALYTAILAAGYGVRDTDGSVLQTIERGQGLVFNAWEVATTAKLYGEGYGVTLKHLSDAFTRNVPEFKGVPLAMVLLEGIRAGAKSGHPAVRFWARFIVELGRHAEAPYDLLGQADAAKVRLDAAQTAFILTRLTGDLVFLERRERQARSVTDLGEDGGQQYAAAYHTTPYFDGSDNNKQEGHIKFMRAGMKRGGSGSVKAQGTAQLPCSLGDIEGLILDYNALGMTTGFGLLAGYLGEKVSIVDKYGKGVSVANLILTVLKFLASYALLDTKITMDGQPLTRTKDTQPGERRTLNAKLQMDTGKWQTLNCVRPALNAAGLDFNLPSDGPLSGVNVEWLLVEGGDSRGWLGTIQDFSEIMSGNATYGDGIVLFDALPGTERSPAKQYTDADGVSRIQVVGVPQKKDLSREKLTETNKVAGVRVDIQLKPMKIKNAKDVASNLGDIAGNVIAFLTGDPLGGAVGTVAETLYRSNWYRSEPFYFLVKDWEPCAGQWSGTITSSTRVETNNLEGGGTQDFMKKDESMYRLVANIKLEGAKTTGTIEAEESLLSDQKSGYGRIVYQRKASAQYSGEVKASVGVSSSGMYSVGFELPRMIGTVKTSGSCERPAPHKCQQPTPTSDPWEPDRYMPGISGMIDSKKPNEIDETRTWKIGPTEYAVTVNLKRCM